MAAALRSTQSSAQSIKATIEILKHGKKPEWEDNMVEVLHNYFVPELNIVRQSYAAVQVKRITLLIFNARIGKP